MFKQTSFIPILSIVEVYCFQVGLTHCYNCQISAIFGPTADNSPSSAPVTWGAEAVISIESALRRWKMNAQLLHLFNGKRGRNYIVWTTEATATERKNWYGGKRAHRAPEKNPPGRVFSKYTRICPKVSGLAVWSENCKRYSSLSLVAVYLYFVSQSNEFCRHNPLCCYSMSVCCWWW
jgi:hypothetical protein